MTGLLFFPYWPNWYFSKIFESSGDEEYPSLILSLNGEGLLLTIKHGICFLFPHASILC